MKRYLKIMFIFLCVALLVGCQKTANEINTESNPENNQSIHTNKKTLVVYFSATGTTKKLAQEAANILNADIYEIIASDPYTKEDLAYYTDCRANQEQDDKSARPQISNKVDNMQDYDQIVLGYPIWHGHAPRIVNTFLESYDFSNKTILPFCTSGGSDMGTSDSYLHQFTASSTSWHEGKRLLQDSSQQDLKDFLAILSD